MRATAPPLLPIFRSRLQRDLLALLLVDTQRSWTLDELAERTREPYQTIATEVRRLQQADLVASSSIGRTKLLSANATSPYLAPLTQLVLMSFGPPLVIGEEFDSLTGIERVFIYGSWAARYEGEVGPAPADIDVLVIGRVDRDDLVAAAHRAERRVGRDVNVTQRTAKQWTSATGGFTTQLRSSPMIAVPSPPGRAEMEQAK